MQTSAFGAFLDVLVDLLTRGLLWSWALPGGAGLAVVLLETTTFTCTHAVRAGGAAPCAMQLQLSGSVLCGHAA